MATIQTPLAQVLSPVSNPQSIQPVEFGLPPLQQAALDAKERKQKQEDDLQRLSNLGQGAQTGLEIIDSDPINAEKNLRSFIDQRVSTLKELGFNDLSDTEALKNALDTGGVPAAQELLSTTLRTAESLGFQLPQPTTPKFTGQFKGVDPETGKEVTFLRNQAGEIKNTGIEAPERTPPFNIDFGTTAKDSNRKFNELFDKSKNIDDLANKSTILLEGLENETVGLTGTSGKLTNKVVDAARFIGGVARNFGLGSEEFDQNSIIKKALGKSELGKRVQKSAKLKSIIGGLGFAIARADNRRGVITEPDYRRGIERIAGSAEKPEDITAVVRQFLGTEIAQFEEDINRASQPEAFNFSDKRKKLLLDLKGVERFKKSLKNGKSGAKQNNVSINENSLPEDLTVEQSRDLLKNNRELFLKILENGRSNANN